MKRRRKSRRKRRRKRRKRRRRRRKGRRKGRRRRRRRKSVTIQEIFMAKFFTERMVLVVLQGSRACALPCTDTGPDLPAHTDED